jgi:hypothetical protein
LTEPTGVAADAATILFNLPDYRVISTTVAADGQRQVIIESEQPPGCPSCGVVASRRKERRFQRIRDIPVAGTVEVLWSKYRWYCGEPACDRLSFFESTPQVPRRARSTGRLRDQLVDAVIRSGRAVSETAAGFAVSWWMVRAALNEACLLKLPDVDALNPRMLGIDEHRFRSVRYFQDPESKTWTRFEPWMTTIVDLDTGQVLGVVDGRDHQGVGDWLFARPLHWRLAVQVVAIDPSAAFRKALRMWLPRTALTWLISLVRDFWAMDRVEDGLLFGVDVGANLCVVPLMAMVAERRGRSCLMTLATASPVLFWTVLETASAVNTIVRCASIASRVRWNMGLARRSVLLIRKDCSTCHRSW